MNIIIDLRPLNGGNHSGVEIYTENLIKNLIKYYPENKYFLYTNSFQDQSFLKKKFSQNTTFIQTKYPNKFLNIFFQYFSTIKIDQLIQKELGEKIKFDLYFQPDLRPFKISKNIKSVVTIHDLAFHHFPKFYSWKSRLWYLLLNPKKTINHFDHITTVSDSTKKDLIETFNISEKKVTRIYPATPEIIKLENFSSIKEKYQIKGKYFLTLSTLEPRKNLIRTIKAFSKFQKENPDYQLLIAGNSNLKIFENPKLEKYKNSNIKLIGFIEENEKYQLIKNSVALIYASLFEGFGFPILESQECQTQIITSNTSSMKEIATDFAIIVDPYSANSIQAGMQKAVTKNYSPTNFQEKFNWKKAAQNFEQLFSSLISN